jgi:membrane protease YdiL (CAAX protease family)
MDYSPYPYQLPQKPWIDRLLAFFEVLMLSGIISSVLASLIFAGLYRKNADLMTANAKILTAFILLESALTFLFLLIILKAHGETISGLGLRWIRWKSNFLIGLACAPFLLIINAFIALIFRNFLPDYYLETNPLTESIQTPLQLCLFIFTALIAGGIKEELQRAFIIRRFSRYLGGAGLGLLLWSFAFGAGHYVQGVQGIVTATIYGLIFGLLYLIRGSLIGPMVAHGAYDTLALLLFWFFSSKHL